MVAGVREGDVMQVQTFNAKSIEWNTQLEADAIRLETKNATFEIRENPNGSILVRACNGTLVIVATDSSSAIMVAAPFDNNWIADVNGKAYWEQEGDVR